MTPKSVQKDEGISGVAPLGAPLVALTAFGHQKLPPRAPKGPPMIEKSTKNDPKEPADCEKELPNSSFLGTWPGGLREALTIRRPILASSVWDYMLQACFQQSQETKPSSK